MKSGRKPHDPSAPTRNVDHDMFPRQGEKEETKHEFESILKGAIERKKYLEEEKSDFRDVLGATFKEPLVRLLLSKSFTEKTRISGVALSLSVEYLRYLTVEAIQRASKVAAAEGSVTVEPHHLEQVLPQLLLDF